MIKHTKEEKMIIITRRSRARNTAERDANVAAFAKNGGAGEDAGRRSYFEELAGSIGQAVSSAAFLHVGSVVETS
jgi:hypothetical protein